VLAVALLLAGLGASTPKQVQAMPPMTGSHGLVCTTNPSGTFTLTAKSGSVSLTDGNVVPMWGYAPGGVHGFQYPGPVLCVNQG
jgi:hypothetical protein